MVNYKLVYFDVRGRAEPVRMLLHHEGIPFEDVRFPGDQWPTYKPGENQIGSLRPIRQTAPSADREPPERLRLGMKSGYTWVDFQIADVLVTTENIAPGSISSSAEAKAYIDRVYSIPKIKDYIANRKVTPW